MKVDTGNVFSDGEFSLVLFFEFVRGLVSESLMNSRRVVAGFDVLEDAGSDLIDIGKVFELRPLVFERPEESLHDGVVVAASSATHGAGDVERS